MRKIEILLVIIVLGCAVKSYPQSLSAGSGVTYSLSGSKNSGKVLKVTLGEKEPMTTLTQSGKGVKVLMKEIKRIEKTGKSWKITPSWSYTESSYELFEVLRTNGYKETLAFYESPIFDVASTTGRTENSQWVVKMQYIKAL